MFILACWYSIKARDLWIRQFLNMLNEVAKKKRRRVSAQYDTQDNFYCVSSKFGRQTLHVQLRSPRKVHCGHAQLCMCAMSRRKCDGPCNVMKMCFVTLGLGILILLWLGVLASGNLLWCKARIVSGLSNRSILSKWFCRWIVWLNIQNIVLVRVNHHVPCQMF